MLSTLTGYGPYYQAPIYSLPPAPAIAPVATRSIVDRTAVSDTVTLSAAGIQAAQAAGDADADGDSR